LVFMKQRIGLIQTRGIGDILIALPIADYFLKNNCEVFWPIDERFVEMFQRVKPDVNFSPVDGNQFRGRDFFLNEPLRLLGDKGLDRTIILYSYLSGANISDPRLSGSLKFDEYKYAIAGVPFDRKWSLSIRRDEAREQALFDSLEIERDFVVVHDTGFNAVIPIKLASETERDFQVIKLTEITDSPFDWLMTLERASELYLIDSSIANLVEQMNIPTPKRLFLRSPALFTPVYKNGWKFSYIEPIKTHDKIAAT